LSQAHIVEHMWNPHSKYPDLPHEVQVSADGCMFTVHLNGHFPCRLREYG